MNVGVAEAKDRLSELIDRAEGGEEVVITRHGRAVATLQPARRKPSREEIAAVLREMDEAKRDLPPISTEEIVASIREGRRF